MYKGRERRCHPRYKAGRLQVSVRRVIPDSTPGDDFKVVAYDFNHLGLAFDAHIALEIGEQLLLTLRHDHLLLTGLIATIRNRNEWRYGVAFDFSTAEMNSIEILDGLENLEAALKGSYAGTVSSSALRKMKRRDRYGE